MQEMQVQSTGQEHPLEDCLATHSSILALRIPWTEEPGGPQSMGSQRVGHGWGTNTHTHMNLQWTQRIYYKKSFVWWHSKNCGIRGRQKYILSKSSNKRENKTKNCQIRMDFTRTLETNPKFIATKWMLTEDKSANLGETALWHFNLPRLCPLSQLSSSFEDTACYRFLVPQSAKWT